MDAESLSRIQFAFTASFHFIFPPLSMGLGLMLLVVSGAYLRTKDPKWRQLAFFWTKVYGLIFALGVATGIVQEFEFGMNWADYSRFVGNVFGSLLAAEGVFAFFLEGGFLGLMLFGGNRLGPRLWFFATFMVVFGAHFSALWILMANSWMQTPQGFEVVSEPAPARAVMTSFAEVVFTPSFLPRLFHVFAASWTAGAALMLSVSAWYLLKKRHLDLARANFGLALPFFIVFAISNVVFFGANMAIEVTHEQPIKLASMEGLWQGTTCAPLYIVGWVDVATQTTNGISIPCLLSVLAYFNPQAYVTGLNDFAGEPTPPIALLFQVYHLMFGLGSLFVPVGLLGGLFYILRKGRKGDPDRPRRIWDARFVLWLFVITVFFVELAITAGWWTAEIGRQPWVVYEVLLTEDGHSPLLSAIDVILSLGMFVILYALLLVLFLYLLNKKIQLGPEPLEEVETVEMSSLPDTFRDVFRRRDRADVKELAMTLADLWFVLFILIVAGYLILDGFDMGVGILHLPFARTDMERRTFLNSIGPVWDGNEVWLVLAGGVLFAVFPLVYASLFSGFYLAFVLVLLVLILRPVALEFRSKEPSPRWRSTWDMVFGATSAGLALLLGIAFGNVLSGVPLDADGNIQVSLIDLLTPFALLVGVTTVAMLAAHGAIYLVIKTEDELQARLVRVVPRLLGIFFVLNTLVVITMVLFQQQITERYTNDIWPVIFPAAALLALIAAWMLVRRGEMFRAFICSSAMIALLIVSGAIGIYPNLLISTTDPAYNLTVTNAASADNTLMVCLIVALIGIPFVLLYTTGVYYIFRGKATVDSDGY